VASVWSGLQAFGTGNGTWLTFGVTAVSPLVLAYNEVRPVVRLAISAYNSCSKLVLVTPNTLIVADRNTANFVLSHYFGTVVPL